MAVHANITRRSALSMLSATVIAAPMPTAAQAEADEHPDAGLILLGELLDAKWAEERLWIAKRNGTLLDFT